LATKCQAQWGLGLEPGFILADTIATDHGFYFHVGLKFDERLFGIGQDRPTE
jgi:hypothetical protein